jgi:hypothetical protein
LVAGAWLTRPYLHAAHWHALIPIVSPPQAVYLYRWWHTFFSFSPSLLLSALREAHRPSSANLGRLHLPFLPSADHFPLHTAPAQPARWDGRTCAARGTRAPTSPRTRVRTLRVREIRVRRHHTSFIEILIKAGILRSGKGALRAMMGLLATPERSY